MSHSLSLPPLESLDPERFERADLLKKLVSAHRHLAEFKGVVTSMPNQDILLSTLSLQEAKDSSEIENIVTTHDELFREVAQDANTRPAAREVADYNHALRVGLDAVRSSGLLTCNHIIEIQAELEKNRAGFRQLPGTVLVDAAGRVVYTPPALIPAWTALFWPPFPFMVERLAGFYDVNPGLYALIASLQAALMLWLFYRRLKDSKK